MSAGRDVERLIASWLAEEAASGAPDRLLESARWAVKKTRQRRFVAVRRDAMNTTLARIAGLAAVVVLAVGAVAWLGRAPGPNTGAVSPSPTSAGAGPTQSATPLATETPLSTGTPLLPPTGLFSPGTYLVSDPLLVDITVRFASEGWARWNPKIWPQLVAVYQNSPDPPGLGIVIAQVENVYANACREAEGLLDPPVGPTVDDLVDALAAQPQTTSTAVTETTISGFAGKHLEIDFAPAGTCSRLARWPSDGGNREAISGEHDELWVLDVDGERWLIDLFSFRTTDPADIAEAREIIEGLVIEP